MAMVYRAKEGLPIWNLCSFIRRRYISRCFSIFFNYGKAIRGAARFKTSDGKEFMQKYDERKSLAPRDIVARAIDNEMKIRGDEFVYLVCSPISKEELHNHFPNIFSTCLAIGLNIEKIWSGGAGGVLYVRRNYGGRMGTFRSWIYMPAANVPPPDYTALTDWPAIHCSKPCICSPYLSRCRWKN